jgi:hypothetical protein
MVRNWIYYIKQHSAVICIPKEWVKFFFLFLKTAIYEDEKKAKLQAMFRGLRDAKKLCKSVADRKEI